MNNFTRPALLLCFTLATSAFCYSARAATIDEQTSARLDALEKENSALRARVNRLEAPKMAKIQNRPAVDADPAFASAPRPQNADILAACPVKAVGAPISNAPRFEASGSLLYLQPGAGDLEYGDIGDPFSHSDAQLEQSVAHAKIQSCFYCRGSLYSQLVQRYRIELDTSEQHHEWRFFRHAHANGRTAFLDWPRSERIQERARHGEIRV